MLSGLKEAQSTDMVLDPSAPTPGLVRVEEKEEEKEDEEGEEENEEHEGMEMNLEEKPQEEVGKPQLFL